MRNFIILLYLENLQNMKARKLLFIVCTLIIVQLSSFAQSNDTLGKVKQDTLKPEYHFSGFISATNNGLSFIPTFSLGKPATIFNLSMGGSKLSFDPEFRFSMEGRPWSFIFWWRYKLVNDKKFKLNLGAHPALSFSTVETNVNGNITKSIKAVRYAATEIVPNYVLSKNLTVGIYYLYSHGLDVGATNNTHFFTINSSISNIKLLDDVYLKFTPQLYYLKMDARDGYYASSTFTLNKKNCPISISGVANKIINSSIPSKDFVWNATIAYSFNNKFTRK